MNSTFC